MGRKLLERLFYEGIIPREQCCPQKSAYHDNLELCDTVERELTELFSPEQKAMFEDYKSYVTRLTTLENEECFIQGMALGIRLVSEAFILEDTKKE